MEHPLADFHDELGIAMQKARPLPRPGLRSAVCATEPRFSEPGLHLLFDAFSRREPVSTSLENATNQPRVRERIMKLSKVYSATCHHNYWAGGRACIAS